MIDVAPPSATVKEEGKEDERIEGRDGALPEVEIEADSAARALAESVAAASIADA